MAWWKFVRLLIVATHSFYFGFDVPCCRWCFDGWYHVFCYCGTGLSCESNECTILSSFSTSYLYILLHHRSLAVPCRLVKCAFFLHHVLLLMCAFCVLSLVSCAGLLLLYSFIWYLRKIISTLWWRVLCIWIWISPLYCCSLCISTFLVSCIVNNSHSYMKMYDAF